MIELDRHIEILLLSNDCVIVPGLGGFMTHHVEARYDEDDQMFSFAIMCNNYDCDDATMNRLIKDIIEEIIRL